MADWIRLTELLKKHLGPYTQKDLAEYVNFNPGHISRLLSGDRKPSYIFLEKFVSFVNNGNINRLSSEEVKELYKCADIEISDEKIKDLCELADASSRSSHDYASDPAKTPSFYVPYLDNPDFVGRDKELAELHKILTNKPKSESTRLAPIGLTGMGGIGKTQLAVVYAHRKKLFWTGGIFWINAANRLIEEFGKLAAAFDLIEHAELKSNPLSLEKASKKALDYLDKDNILIIADNLEDPSLLSAPIAFNVILLNLKCQILFTTKRRDLPESWRSLNIGVLSEESAIHLLTHGRSVSQDLTFAKQISATLGYLPLALKLASSYLIKYKQVTLEHYQKELIKAGAIATIDNTSLSENDLPTRHTAAVKATLETQWKNVDKDDAKKIFIAAGIFPEASLIPSYRLGLLTGLSTRVLNNDQIDKTSNALSDLYDLSLVEKLDNDYVRLHPLVREFSAKLVSREISLEMANTVVDTLNNISNLVEQLKKINLGVSFILEDIRIAQGLFASNELRNEKNYEVSQCLEKVLDREFDNLTKTSQREIYFAQQIANRINLLGVSNLNSLIEKNKPYIQLTWLSGSVYPELLRSLQGHKKPVTTVSITDKFIISGSADKTIKFWDIHTGREIRTIENAHNEPVSKVYCVESNGWLISASRDKTIKIWDINSGTCLEILEEHEEAIRSISYIPNKQQIVSVSQDGYLKIRNFKGETKSIKISAFDLVYFKDKNLLVLASADKINARNKIKLYDLNYDNTSDVDLGHRDIIRSVDISNDGHWLVTGSEDGSIGIVATSRLAHENSNSLIEGHKSSIKSVKISPDNRHIASGSTDNNIKIWDLKNRQLLKTLRGHSKHVLSVAFFPDGQRVVSASEDSTIKIWDISKIQKSDEFDEHLQPYSIHTNSINSLILINKSQLIISASEDKTVKTWNTHDGSLRETYPLNSEVLSLTYDEDSNLIFAGTRNGLIHIINLNVNAVLNQRFEIYQKGNGGLSQINFLHNSKDLAIVSDFKDEHNIKLWNLNAKNERLMLRGHESIIKTLNLDVMHSLLISSSNDKTIKIWDYVTGTLLKNYSSKYEIKSLDINCSQLVYASGNGDLVILDLQTLNEIKSISLRIQVRNICINQNVVIFSHGNEIKIYDLVKEDYIANAHIDYKINCLKAVWAEDIQIFVGDVKGNIYKFMFSLQNREDIFLKPPSHEK